MSRLAETPKPLLAWRLAVMSSHDRNGLRAANLIHIFEEARP